MTGRNKFSALIEGLPAERRERIAAKAAELRAEMPLHELRRALDLSQKQIGEILEVNQASVSKLERRTDMYISTLRSYIEAMGGRLDVVAHLPGGDVRISNFGDLSDDDGDAVAAAG